VAFCAFIVLDDDAYQHNASDTVENRANDAETAGMTIVL
jgi:hypothetical protein